MNLKNLTKIDDIVNLYQYFLPLKNQMIYYEAFRI